jgi:hypothetical protein
MQQLTLFIFTLLTLLVLFKEGQALTRQLRRAAAGLSVPVTSVSANRSSPSSTAR